MANLSVEEQIDLVDWIRDVLIKKVGDKEKKAVENVLEYFQKGEVEHMTYAMERMIDDLKEYGREQGLEQGFAQGELTKTIHIIRKLLRNGQSPETIADLLELRKDEMKKILRYINDNETLSDVKLAKKLFTENFTPAIDIPESLY